MQLVNRKGGFILLSADRLRPNEKALSFLQIVEQLAVVTALAPSSAGTIARLARDDCVACSALFREELHKPWMGHQPHDASRTA